MLLPKKIFIVSTSLLAALLLLWGIYYFSFQKPGQSVQKNQPVAKTAPQAESTSSSDNSAGNSKITAISEEPVLSPVLSGDDTIVKYYSAENGKTFQVGIDGKNKGTISTKELPRLADVFWSPGRTKAITKFSQDGSAVRFYFYDYSSGQGVPLKNNIDSIAWESDSKIFYKYYNPSTKERSLNISNPDGTEWRKILDLDLKDVRIERVPQTSLVSFWTVPDAYTKTILRSTSLVGTDDKTLFQEKFGADYKWNGAGTKILLSHTDDADKSKIRLAMINNQGGEYKNLEIPTLVAKCAWSVDNQTVYYALPGSIPDNSVMPNDYTAKKFTTADTFWKVDTATGEKNRLVELNKIPGKLDAINLFLNSDESLLFFTNRVDGKLYRISLN
ncbi:MAG TPA: hypothetical protein VF390_00705 [Patescibacteria group bacterium]